MLQGTISQDCEQIHENSIKNSIRYRNYIEMDEQWQQPLSMEAIPEESERLQTENHNKEEADDSNSFELLIKAHDRIRTLETENQELHQQLAELSQMEVINKELVAEVQRLRNTLREKEIRIENLENLNQKAILDYVKLERQLLLQKKEGRLKRNLTALPNELSSPLHPIIRNYEQEQKSSKPKESNHFGKQAVINYRDVFKKEERLRFSSKENKEGAAHMEFTFDGGLKKAIGSPCKEKVLKNCFSVNEMSKLINKVHSRHDSQLNHQKAKVKEYNNFCSSMQKKFSPATSLKKDSGLPKKYPLHINQQQSPKNFQFRGSTPQRAGKYELNSTSSSQTGTPFNIWKSENYSFV